MVQRGISHIFAKLNIAEQQELNMYINRENNSVRQECNKMIDNAKAALDKDKEEIRDYYAKRNEKTWQRIGTSLIAAMRKNKISLERIDKINAEVKELNEKHELLIGEETKSEYKIMQSDDFAKLFELLAYKYCNNCTSRNSNCEVYPLMKKYGIPRVNEGFKCKYGYKLKGGRHD